MCYERDHDEVIANLKGKLATVTAERDALRERCEKLEKIPHHHAKWCGITDYYSKGPCKCTCGLEAALSS